MPYTVMLFVHLVAMSGLISALSLEAPNGRRRPRVDRVDAWADDAGDRVPRGPAAIGGILDGPHVRVGPCLAQDGGCGPYRHRGIRRCQRLADARAPTRWWLAQDDRGRIPGAAGRSHFENFAWHQNRPRRRDSADHDRQTGISRIFGNSRGRSIHRAYVNCSQLARRSRGAIGRRRERRGQIIYLRPGPNEAIAAADHGASSGGTTKAPEAMPGVAITKGGPYRDLGHRSDWNRRT
jgi:hypothetical protein